MKKNIKKPFVITTDKNVAKELIKNKFTLLLEENNKWTFVNDKTMNFSNSNIDMTKVAFTNVLCMTNT